MNRQRRGSEEAVNRPCKAGASQSWDCWFCGTLKMTSSANLLHRLNPSRTHGNQRVASRRNSTRIWWAPFGQLSEGPHNERTFSVMVTKTFQSPNMPGHGVLGPGYNNWAGWFDCEWFIYIKKNILNTWYGLYFVVPRAQNTNHPSQIESTPGFRKTLITEVSSDCLQLLWIKR